MYEYCPESELRNRGGTISAGDGSKGWTPWRVDAAGTAWYRREVGAPSNVILGVGKDYFRNDADDDTDEGDAE